MEEAEDVGVYGGDVVGLEGHCVFSFSTEADHGGKKKWRIRGFSVNDEEEESPLLLFSLFIFLLPKVAFGSLSN